MTSSSSSRPDNSEALAVFVARKAEFEPALAQSQQLSDDHFQVAPDEVTWGDAGDLGHRLELLRRITDRAFGEGECAHNRPLSRPGPDHVGARVGRRRRIGRRRSEDTTDDRSLQVPPQHRSQRPRRRAAQSQQQGRRTEADRPPRGPPRADDGRHPRRCRRPSRRPDGRRGVSRQPWTPTIGSRSRSARPPSRLTKAARSHPMVQPAGDPAAAAASAGGHGRGGAGSAGDPEAHRRAEGAPAAPGSPSRRW